MFPENTARLEKQRATDISVIVMNPPYRTGQSSANDAAQNAKYPKTDARIAETYAKRSSASNKNGLYDSYYRALRWATDRLGDEGVIAFVSNSGFIDGGTADGVRLSWGDEFSDVVVFNLRGNQRVKNWQAEGGKVFGEGSQTGIAITILVKDPSRVGPARVHYADVGDYLGREEKLDKLRRERSADGTDFQTLTPNDAGDWINQRDERFGTWQPLGDKATKGKPSTTGIFRDYSLGVDTKRDAWVFSFSASEVTRNGRRAIDEFNELVDDDARAVDATRIAWSRKMESRRRSGKRLVTTTAPIRIAAYRPFLKQRVWFDRQLIDLPGIAARAWPITARSNLALAVGSDGRNKTLPMLIEAIPSLDFSGASQIFPRYTWEPASAPDGALNLEALAASDSDEIVDGYRRVDNITDATLEAYRAVHGDDVTKDDIFYAIYALLHHPTYRETYAADLQKMLPRIPQVKGFSEYARIGRELAALHLDYESVAQADLGEQINSIDPPADPFELYRIDKLAWVSRKDHTAIRYNAHLTITGIPLEESEYKVGGRSPLEWILDRYQVKVDKASGIVNDPNAWLREQENPRYVVDLIRSLVTVSLETQRLVSELPEFEVIE